MYGVVRTYSGAGAKELMDVLAEHKSELETLIKEVHGFVAYQLVRAGDGGFSVTICQDEAGCDESIKLASDWIRENASSVHANPPVILEGEVILQI